MAIVKDGNTRAESEGAGATMEPSARQLLPVRLTFLTFYMSLGSLLPYLPVYYHSLGLSGTWIGILGAVNPMTTFLISPLWGAFADKTGLHKQILLCTFAASVVMRVSMILSNSAPFLVFVVFITALLNAPVKPLLDSSVMNMLPDKKSYGKMRLWGQLGFGLGSSAVGILLSKSKLSFKLAFLIHALLAFPTLVVMRSFSPSIAGNSEPPDFRAGIKLLRSNIDALVFFTLVFVIGISSGIIENFAYVRMREVGGTGREMGISRFVSAAAGVPMFWYAGAFTKGLGVSTVLIMSLFSYSARFFIYASMKHALAGLPAEALRGATFALFWSTATIYAHQISPPGMSATLLSVMNAMYGGLGQSFGAIIGGKLQSTYGTTRTFQISGCVDLAFVLVVGGYFLLKSKKIDAEGIEGETRESPLRPPTAEEILRAPSSDQTTSDKPDDQSED